VACGNISKFLHSRHAQISLNVCVCVSLITVFERVKWFDVFRVVLESCAKVNGVLYYSPLNYGYIELQEVPEVLFQIRIGCK